MSRLTQTLGLLYRMADDDIRTLADEIYAMRTRSWQTAITLEARTAGCNQAVRSPGADSRLELRRASDSDAAQIARTHNRDLESQIERLYAANARGNRQYYYANLDTWSRQRSAWKRTSIALNTDVTTSEAARREFRSRNYSALLRYVFSGPPPSCADCSRRFAAGVVNQEYVDKFPCPRHINCPHSWQIVNRPRVPCSELWVGE